MYAKNLERIFFHLCERSDVSHSLPDEYVERFNSLRGSALLPRGRERRERELSKREIANAVFGLVSSRPGWAAFGARLLSNLRPVGGIGASFFGAATLNDAVQLLLSNTDARKSFVRLTVTLAETGVNSSGGATLLHDQDGERRHVFFVPGLAISLFVPGREIGFDPEKHRRSAAAAREMTFSQEFFRRLAQECETAKLFPSPPEGDGSEYNSEEEQQQRFRKLGVRWGSRFLNIGVDNQVTWPSEETHIKFDCYTLVLFPKTKENVQSVHMDLTANRLDLREAMTIVNRFLSVMAWCDDNFAIAQDGWSGNPAPVAVPRHELAFRTTFHYLFDRKLPASQDAMRALALYREARNAQENKFVSYAVLNFYKIIEIRNHGKEHVRRWFRENFEALRQGNEETVDIEEFLALCGGEAPEKYIHNSCRIAVAHANKYSKSDPDDASEIDRLHKAARIMHLLARRFIKNEFEISDQLYSGD
jgi:hypothetical protein